MRRKCPGLKPAAEAMDSCMPTNVFLGREENSSPEASKYQKEKPDRGGRKVFVGNKYEKVFVGNKYEKVFAGAGGEQIPKRKNRKDVGRHTRVVEEHRMRAEAVPRGAVDCIGERMQA